MKNFFYFPTAAEVAKGFGAEFVNWMAEQPKDRPLTISLSGGSTPQALFELWATEYRDQIDWRRLHFFWGDERCVTADSPDSNFGVAKRLWLDKVDIPADQIYPILGDQPPKQESQRYADLIKKNVQLDSQGNPRFDLILLGMGDDGHFASIFPNQLDLLESNNICEVANHPTSGQKRITLTGSVINRAHHIAFLITGQNKKKVFDLYRQQGPGHEKLPITYIRNHEVDFFLEDCLRL